MGETCGSIVDLYRYFFDPGPLSFECYNTLRSLAGRINIGGVEYFKLFVSTVALEAVFYVFGFFVFTRKLEWSKILSAILLGNVLTHPVVCLVLPKILASMPYGYYLLIAEVFAPVVEAIVLRRFGLSWTASLLTSFAANLFSWNFALVFLGS